ncbi:6-phosphogluconate dehydrogenase [Streptomyces spiroverticillatus]|uniref:6-phosphogluconate dehydrogenase n=1 Tax=Streptomyces finlayi TaxID=67296 RepID=A0A918X1E6_9ACTN|nr:NAD(P)-binding domain-containing protein [Streptomyces finlayi]GHA19968.1 6-phosphogluconate dehydrogenase [Streptomyces spiroverticillatus]GHD02804.1 6-phosphogluconate dehydrogenase [Streptomyces finlayi]
MPAHATPAPSASPVTVLGLGLMGYALADALLTAGHQVTVWNRTPAKADPLVARGATLAPSVREAIESSPLTISCVLDYDTQHALLTPAAGALHGRTLVSLTNGTPAQARETEAWALALGATYLDGGIMAVPHQIDTPEAFLFYSGAQDPFDQHHPTLSVLGTPHHLSTDVGVAALYDLALLSAMDMMFAGFFHATAVATSHKGTSATDFAPHLVAWLTSMLSMVPLMAADIDSPAAPAYAQSLDLVAAAAQNMADAAREAGVLPDHFDRSVTALRQRIASGETEYTAASAVSQLRVPARG